MDIGHVIDNSDRQQIVPNTESKSNISNVEKCENIDNLHWFNLHNNDEKYVNVDQSVRLLHLNIRSIYNKINQLEVLLENYKSKVDILCFSEHWLTKLQLETAVINDFEMTANFIREGQKGGGVCIYVRTGMKFKYKIRKDINQMAIEREFEICAIEVTSPKPFIIITLYRAPDVNSKEEFLDKIESLLTYVSKNETNVILIGDYNYNVMDNKLKYMLQDTVSICDFKILNTQTTRTNYKLSGNSETCIDIALTNCDSIVFEENVELGLSDHLGQILCIQQYCKIENNKKESKQRSFRKCQIESFTIEMSKVRWDEIYRYTDLNDIFETFMNIFMDKFNEAFPYKRINRSNQCKSNNSNAWYDDELKEMAHQLRNLLNTYKLSSNICDKKRYNNFKRKYEKAILTAKRNYNANNILKSIDKSKAAWKLINLNKTAKVNKSNDIQLNIDDELITSQQEVSLLFNDYFSDIVKKLLTDREKTRPTSNQRDSPNIDRLVHNIFLAPMTKKEFYEITDKVCKKFSAGYDEIPASILKTIVSFIAEPFIFMINESFVQGIFPELLKNVIVKPCFKNGDKTLLENYRPLAILSVFSKIFEMAMCNRILKFLHKFQILNTAQHGFTKGKSTISAICNFITNIFNSIEDHKQTFGIFYDFSKAFDTVNHSILLEKLNNMGISGLANKWIESFLKDRKQIVQLNSETESYKSNEVIINVGVPQGSTISPLLFILFTNDITSYVNKGSLTLFADDTTHFISAVKDEIVNVSRSAVQQLENWCLNNDLFLNKKKTVLLQFSTKRTVIESSPLITIEGTSIHEQQDTKFLGLIVDNTLDWEKHISNVCQKVASGCYLVKRIMNLCNFETAKIVYFAYIQSRLQYGIILWGNSQHANRLFILQKKAIRYLARASTNPCSDIYCKDSCSVLFKKFKIMTLPSLYIFMSIMYVYENKNALITNKDVHDYFTRGKDNIHIKKHNLKMTDKCPEYAGSIFYNNLPNYIKQESGVRFKLTLKNYLIDKCFYKVNDFFQF